MYHVPIVDSEIQSKRIEFCHISRTHRKGEWGRERPVCLDHIKLNVFMQGSFSVVVKDKIYTPVYGDLCILPPLTIHYGKIPKDTYADYYQFDIGIEALSGIPKGAELLKELTASDTTPLPRPNKDTVSEIINLCRKTEKAISENNLSLAFALTIELLNIFVSVLKSTGTPEMHQLSKYIIFAVEYIGKNFSSDIKIGKIAEMCGVSESYISRQFKKEVGVSVHTYLCNLRLLKSTYMLKEKSVAETAFACGFCDSSHYICCFKKMFGCTPTYYIKNY